MNTQDPSDTPKVPETDNHAHSKAFEPLPDPVPVALRGSGRERAGIRYTRSQAIEAGLIVSVREGELVSTGPVRRRCGFWLPVALTKQLWNRLDLDADDKYFRRKLKEKGRTTGSQVSTVLAAFECQLRSSGGASTVEFTIEIESGINSGRFWMAPCALVARIEAEGVTIGFGEDFWWE